MLALNQMHEPYVEIAAFDGTVGVELLLKCSGFIDLAVYYHAPDELFDKNGNPVKITTIPDRTKGMVRGIARILAWDSHMELHNLYYTLPFFSSPSTQK